MTNGEKIVNVFKCEVYEPIVEDNIIHVAFDKGDTLIGFDLDWWNSEYLCKDCINKVLRPKVRKIMKRKIWRDGLSR